MITAVDTSVLLDIFTDDSVFRAASLASLRACVGDGPLVACDVVWAEICAAFPDPASASRALEAIPVAYEPIGHIAAARAGSAWRDYRREGGPRGRVIADFLIGAHAFEQADRLLTRDRGFHRKAFEGLVIVDPSAPGAGS